MPLIIAIVVPSLTLEEYRYIGPHGRSGKAIRGFLGHLTGSGRQLPEIGIVIRYIVQVYCLTSFILANMPHSVLSLFVK